MNCPIEMDVGGIDRIRARLRAARDRLLQFGGKARTNEAMTGREHSLRIEAYRVRNSTMKISAGVFERPWMNEAESAKRCLPLKIANQTGWMILNDCSTSIFWNGGSGVRDVVIRREATASRVPSLLSHFGHGILTWRIPFLFRTPPGYNLYVRGPSNWPKDGICALDAIVETDWATAPFTMNWKVTKPNAWIRFAQEEPICMVFPIARVTDEQFTPLLFDIDDDLALKTDYRQWAINRAECLTRERRGLSRIKTAYNQYFKGMTATGKRFANHQTNIGLPEFKDAARPGSDSTMAKAPR